MVKDCPVLRDFLGAWFHQDFDIEGSSVSDVVKAFIKVTPEPGRRALKNEINLFLQEEDASSSFYSFFKPDIMPETLAGPVEGFLLQITTALGDGS